MNCVMGLQLLKEESLFAAEFSEFIRNSCANEPTWLRILREKSFAEFEQMFKNAGFSRSELHELPPGPGRLVISYN